MPERITTDNLLGDTLREGLQKLQLELPESAVEQLLAYIALMERWNRVYNLTAVRKPVQMIVRHLLDSLAVVPHLDTGRILDVGTGPGLPGIPIALACPDKQVTLLDSNAKKVRFVTQVIIELEIANATVVHARVEVYEDEHGFAEIISRAFSSLSEFIEATKHLCGPGGRLLAMKGLYPEPELREMPKTAKLEQSIELKVPGLDESRHLLVVNPSI